MLVGFWDPETMADSSFCQYVMSDMIVVWRAWVVSDRRIFRVALTASMIVTLGVYVQITNAMGH